MTKVMIKTIDTLRLEKECIKRFEYCDRHFCASCTKINKNKISSKYIKNFRTFLLILLAPKFIYSIK